MYMMPPWAKATPGLFVHNVIRPACWVMSLVHDDDTLRTLLCTLKCNLQKREKIRAKNDNLWPPLVESDVWTENSGNEDTCIPEGTKAVAQLFNVLVISEERRPEAKRSARFARSTCQLQRRPLGCYVTVHCSSAAVAQLPLPVCCVNRTAEQTTLQLESAPCICTYSRPFHLCGPAFDVERTHGRRSCDIILKIMESCTRKAQKTRSCVLLMTCRYRCTIMDAALA